MRRPILLPLLLSLLVAPAPDGMIRPQGITLGGK